MSNPKIHLVRHDLGLGMNARCGQAAGSLTPDPAQATCITCVRLYREEMEESNWVTKDHYWAMLLHNRRIRGWPPPASERKP